MEQVKQEHTHMEHDLDLVKSNQKDVELFIESLEAALPKNFTPEPERVHLCV